MGSMMRGLRITKQTETQSLWKMAGCILNQRQATGIIPEQDRTWL